MENESIPGRPASDLPVLLQEVDANTPTITDLPPERLDLPDIGDSPDMSGWNWFHTEVLHRVVEGQTLKEIARQYGRSYGYIRNITSSKLFKNALEHIRAEGDRRAGQRFERLTSEAIEVVKNVMRTSKNEHTKMSAALEILDRAGHVKTEKRIEVAVDAEKVIKELNKQARRSRK